MIERPALAGRSPFAAGSWRWHEDGTTFGGSVSRLFTAEPYMRAIDLIRFWMTFESPVDRRSYLLHGVALTLAKYAGDVALVWLAAGSWWTPEDYLRSVPFLLSTSLARAPTWLAPTLVAWTLPFMWAGICLTMRRVVDAGLSAWAALAFFVPGVSYVVMALLCLLPSRAPRVARCPPHPSDRRLPQALLAIGVGTAVGLGMITLLVGVFQNYGLALFLGTPFTVGALTAYFLCRRYPATVKETLEIVAMTMLLVGGFAFALGTEGAVCLLMVLPFGMLLALLGGVAGRAIARSGATLSGAAVLLLLPAGAGVEHTERPATLREVRTSVDIDAPAALVWRSVVAFPPLDRPAGLLFQSGIAYPTGARIEGEGVGAVRHCDFSTGAFVEPVRIWEPPSRLRFDISSVPPPLAEWSPWEIAPPHLEGYLLPRRGEFRLITLPGGGTRLEGSTWYEQRLRPEGYWVLFSDYIIGRIHERVLTHIRSLAEAEARHSPLAGWEPPAP